MSIGRMFLVAPGHGREATKKKRAGAKLGVAGVLWACLLVVPVGRAGVVLFDERIECEQKTEVRYDVPDGCVITALGFRAHYDNITTMYVRYHRLSAEGRLVEPVEVRLGAEPDHACEAKILLPEGYVAVGFGAAGEPEWDVTLLRITARPLRSDGTLGELKSFNAGFKPEREPEREVSVGGAKRVLTGAGLRFASNDIGGIYACSKRIVRLSEGDRQKLGDFRTRAWAIANIRAVDARRLAVDIGRYGVNRLYVDFKAGQLSDEHLVWFEELREAVAGLQIYLLVDIPRHQELLRRTQETAAVTGIVIDASIFSGGRGRAAFAAGLARGMRTVQGECRRAGKELNLDFGLYQGGPDLWGLLDQVPGDIGVVIPAWYAGSRRGKSGETGQLDPRGSREIIARFELAPHSIQGAALPDVRIDRLPGSLLDCVLAGADGFVVLVDAGGLYLPGTVNALSLDGLHRLAEDPLQPTDFIWGECCRARYGAGWAEAAAALRRTATVNDLLFGIFGREVLWRRGRVVAPGPGEQVGHPGEAGGREDEANLRWAGVDEKSVDRAMEEKETASWLVAQSISDANRAYSANRTAQTRDLLDSLLRLRSAAEFWRDLTEAYLYAGIYAIDGAAVTRARAESALGRLGEPGRYEVAFDGCAGFVRAVERSLAESERRAPLVRALDEVRRLSEAGEDEAAAGALQDLFDSQKLGPHLAKQDHAVAELASSLGALGQTSSNIRVMRHGDGRWLIEKVAGRWSYKIGKGRPCLYIDFLPGRLERPRDYVLSFEYYDAGDWTVDLHYDSDYPPEQKRQYHPAEPLRLTDSRTWKKGVFALSNCLFDSGQNAGADLRFVSGSGVHIRNIRLAPTQGGQFP